MCDSEHIGVRSTTVDAVMTRILEARGHHAIELAGVSFFLGEHPHHVAFARHLLDKPDAFDAWLEKIVKKTVAPVRQEPEIDVLSRSVTATSRQIATDESEDGKTLPTEGNNHNDLYGLELQSGMRRRVRTAERSAGAEEEKSPPTLSRKESSNKFSRRWDILKRISTNSFLSDGNSEISTHTGHCRESARTLEAATEKLSLFSTLTTGFAIESLLAVDVTPKYLMSVEGFYVIFLASAAAVSVFVTAFTLLEPYYIQRADGGLNKTESNLAGFKISLDFDEILDSFNTLRNHARNGTWLSIILILLAVVMRLNFGGLTLVSFTSSTVLIAGIGRVVLLVKRFREAFFPLLRNQLLDNR